MFIRYQSVYFALERQQRRIKEMLQGEMNSEVGICSNLGYHEYSCDSDIGYSTSADYVATEAQRYCAFRTWCGFSGDVTYPIPSHDESPAIIAYSVAYIMGTLWDRSTAYGALRYALLRHMEQRYALFLSHCIYPQRAAVARIFQDDGFGNLELVDLAQDISFFERCDHN